MSRFIWSGDNLVNLDAIEHVSQKGSRLEILYQSGIVIGITYADEDIARREMKQIGMAVDVGSDGTAAAGLRRSTGRRGDH